MKRGGREMNVVGTLRCFQAEFRIRISLLAYPDPGFNLNADPILMRK
jgi:hypothetical protein